VWLSTGIEVKLTCERTGFLTRDNAGAIDRKDTQFRPKFLRNFLPERKPQCGFRLESK